MGALSGAYYGVGYHIIQSGFYYIPRLSGYIGRMDLYIHFLISTDLYRSYLSESFLALSKVFAEKTLSNLHILTFSSNDACPGNTNGNGICILFLLAGILRTCLLFLHTYSDGLYIFFHVVYTLHDRRNNDRSPERMDDRSSTCLTNGKGSRSFGSGTAKRTSQPRTSFQNIASFGRTDIERTGKSFEDADEIKSTTSLSAI